MSNCRCMLVEIPMTPDPKALAVLLDAARACYGDDSEQVRWLLNPEAVRELLGHTPWQLTDDPDNDSSTCAGCVIVSEHNYGDTAHARYCRIAAAWRALGDPRGAADIERAHEEALTQARQRSDGPRVSLEAMQRMRDAFGTRTPIGIAAEMFRPGDLAEFVFGGPPDQLVYRLTSESQEAAQVRASPEDDMQRAMAAIAREGQPWAPIAQVFDGVQRQINERIEAACERVLGHPLTVHDRGALTLRHDRSMGGLVHVTILRNDVEQVVISAAILGDAVDITERWLMGHDDALT